MYTDVPRENIKNTTRHHEVYGCFVVVVFDKRKHRENFLVFI